MNDSGAKAIVVDDAYVEVARTLASQCPSLKHLVYAGDGPVPDGFASFDALCTYEPLAASVTDWIVDDSLAAISYTGGTTGLPKGVDAESRQPARQRKAHATRLRLHPERRVSACGADVPTPPTRHARSPSTWVGACHLMISGWDPASASIDVATAEAMTITLLVPTMINSLVNHAGVENAGPVRVASDGLRRLRRCQRSCSARRLSTLPCGFTQLYGMTEASPLLTVCSADDHTRGAAGEPLYVPRLKAGRCPGAGRGVRGASGRTEPSPTSASRAKSMRADQTSCLGYWNRPEETAKALVDGW